MKFKRIIKYILIAYPKKSLFHASCFLNEAVVEEKNLAEDKNTGIGLSKNYLTQNRQGLISCEIFPAVCKLPYIVVSELLYGGWCM